MIMNNEEIERYFSLVKNARDKILLARGVRDKRMHDKAVREAKKDAQNTVQPHKADLIEICHMENLGDELFDWGHLEGDLEDVYEKLKELCNK